MSLLVVSVPVVPRKKTSISSSKKGVKLSTAPRFSTDSDGKLVRRPRSKARIVRLYHIHEPTLPKIEEEDIAALVEEEEEEESEESSVSVADSVSIYSQASYVSGSDSVSISDFELIDHVDVEDSEDVEGIDDSDDSEQLVEEEVVVVEDVDVVDFDFDDEEDEEDDNDALFANVSAAIARSRARALARRDGIYGKDQLYAREYSIPIMAIARDTQEANQCGSSRTRLRPLLLPISVALRDESRSVDD